MLEKIPSHILQPSSPPGTVPGVEHSLGSDKQKIDLLLSNKDLADWAKEFLTETIINDSALGDEWIIPSFFSKGAATPVIPRYMHKERGYQETPSWLERFFRGDDPRFPHLQREWLRKGFLANDPPWLNKLLSLEEAKVAHMFLLTGNIVDYTFDPAKGYCAVSQKLVDAFAAQKECVLRISLSQGVSIEPASFARQIDNGWINTDFDPTQPLEGQICDLFRNLRLWLEQDDQTGLSRGVAIIVENVHLFIPGHHSMERSFLIDGLLNWSLSPKMFHKQRPPHCIILVADFLEDVSDELRSRGGKIEQVVVDRPSQPDTRLKFLLALRSKAGMEGTRVVRFQDSWGLDYPGNTVEQLQKLAEDTAGLTLMGIEDVIQQSLADKVRLNKDRVMQAKREHLQQESEGLLEVIDPRLTLDEDLAGYETLKIRLREIIQAIGKRENQLVRSTIPMGILFLGPPGTGKTIAAEAIAGESKINMAKLGDFRDMYVGQSERNLSRLLLLIESLHPVIVFMDELDQSEGTRGESGDSGVSKHVFGKLLQFMSDTGHRGNILWIGASNRPDLIDAAMKRPGRFDLVLPFLLPDEPSRYALFKKLLAKKIRGQQAEILLSEGDYQDLAERTAGFSGAEIEGIIGELLRRAVQGWQPDRAIKITKELFDEVLSVYEPPKVKLHYRRMEDLALMEVRYKDLIPESYLERLEQLQNQEKQAIEQVNPFENNPGS